MYRRYTHADVVHAARAVYGEGDAYSRDDVKNFTRFDAVGDLGSPGSGPRGARQLAEEEVVAIVALLPWSAALGGVDGRRDWVRRCRQLLVRHGDPSETLVVEIRPARLRAPREATLSGRRRLDEVYPNAIHVDLGRLRQSVRVALAER